MLAAFAGYWYVLDFSWDNFKVEIDGVDLHYVYQRSSRTDAIPLLLVHGWPGSFYEFDKLIEPLTQPPEDQPAFHVIVPSVTGFAFSSTPRTQRWTVKDTARVLNKLMTEVLGFKTYASQGGDWVSFSPFLLLPLSLSLFLCDCIDLLDKFAGLHYFDTFVQHAKLQGGPP